MTKVLLQYGAPAPDGTYPPVEGVLIWTPTRRRVIAGMPDKIIMPIGFKVPITGGVITVNVAPSGIDWVWRVDELVKGASRVISYRAIPDVEEIDFTDLVGIDPTTLQPMAEPEPIWYSWAEGLALAAGNAEQSAEDSKLAAIDSQTSALASATAAKASEDQAAAYVLQAGGHAHYAGDAAFGAGDSMFKAQAAEAAAKLSEDAAEAAKSDAFLFKQAAETAKVYSEAARDEALAAEALTVSSGNVDGSGHLILTRNDETTHDAGQVAVGLSVVGTTTGFSSARASDADVKDLILDTASGTRGVLNATIATQATTVVNSVIGVEPPSGPITFSDTQPIASGIDHQLQPTSPVTWVAGPAVRQSTGIVADMNPGQIGLNFTVWGKRAALLVYCFTENAYVRISVDDKLITPVDGILVAGAVATVSKWLLITFATDGPHKISINGRNVAWRDVAYESTGALAPAPEALGRRVVVVGDSWVGGALGIGVMNTWAAQICKYLGLPEAWTAGQGGTGYVNTGPGTDTYTQDFGDTRRISKVIAAKPTDVVVFGSINDGGQPEATIRAAAQAYYAALVAALPTVRIHVVLPQPTTNTQQTSADQVSNRRAVRQAAKASPNVYSIIDGVSAGWLTDGNRPLFLGSDSVHPTLAGHAYLGRVISESLRPGLASTAVPLPVVNTYAEDTFTRADGALGSPEGIATPYTITGPGTITVSTNQALFGGLAGTSLAGVYALYDCGSADVASEVTIITSGNGIGPAIRCTADQSTGTASGFILMGDGGVWKLMKRTAYGTFTTLVTSTKSIGAGQVARLVASGNSIKGYVDGVLVADVTDSFNATVTRHGYQAIYSAARLDNWSLTNV